MTKIKAIEIAVLSALCVAVVITLTFAYNEALKREEPRVYITETGNKYHSCDCGYLWASSIPIGWDEALDKGYTACSRCGGEFDGTIIVNRYGKSLYISVLSVTPFISIILLKLVAQKKRTVI